MAACSGPWRIESKKRGSDMPTTGNQSARPPQTSSWRYCAGVVMRESVDRIRDALQHIPVGGHDDRVRTAFMLKSELGDAGRDLWDDWRDGRGDDEAATVWRSASESGPLRINTLFHEAKSNGWRDNGTYQRPTPEELAKRQRDAAEREARDQSEIARERAEAAAKAAALLKAGTEAQVDNPYLARKSVTPTDTLREIDAEKAAEILGYSPQAKGEPLAGRLLVVPVKQGDCISTVELIDGKGRKAALAGRGTKTGGYWATQRLPSGDGAGRTILIGEGVATVQSAATAVGKPAVAALSAGNLLPVAKAMRERYPAAALVILADLVKTTGEPDSHAVEAANAVDASLAIPDFRGNREPEQKDMNDLLIAHGAEAVRHAIGTQESEARSPVAGGAIDLLSQFRITREHVKAMATTELIWRDLIASTHAAVWAAPANAGKTALAKMASAELAADGFRVFYFQEDAAAGDLPGHFEHAEQHGYELLNSVLTNTSPDVQIAVLRQIAASDDDISDCVFFVDTLKKFCDLMVKGGTREFFKLIRALTIRGATVVLLGHTNKHRDPTGKLIFEGVGDIRSDVDELIYLESSEKDAAGRVLITARPDKVRSRVTAVTFSLDTLTMKLTAEDQVVDVASLERRRREMEEDAELIAVVTRLLRFGSMKKESLIERAKTESGAGARRVRRVVNRYAGTLPADGVLWIEEQTGMNNAKLLYLPASNSAFPVRT